MSLSVIKVGGAVVEDPSSLSFFLDRFAALGGERILVHGGGRTATAIASALGLQTRMVLGRRVTDADMLRVVTMVYGGLVSKNIVSGLVGRGISAVGLSGADMGCILAERRPPVSVDGELVDFGFVGDVSEVRPGPFLSLLDGGTVPVLAPLTLDSGSFTLLNTNADTIASSVARALAPLRPPVRLVYCFEKRGVLADPEDENSVIERITREDFARMKADGSIGGGMVPKLENAFAALDAGVSEVVITSASNLGGGTIISL